MGIQTLLVGRWLSCLLRHCTHRDEGLKFLGVHRENTVSITKMS